MIHVLPEHLRTSAVCGILRSMHESRDWSATPLLVDALRDAEATPEQMQAVLLACVSEGAEQDGPRLAMADVWEEAGQGERGEFVRVQVELARTPPCKDAYTPGSKCGCRWHWLRKQEGKLWDTSTGKGRNAKWVLFADFHGFDVRITPGLQARLPSAIASRGFISSLTLPWQSWLTVQASLYWSADQTEECPECGGHKSMMLEVSLPGYGVQQTKKRVPAPCKTCGGSAAIENGRVVIKDGTGRIPRPCPPTSQPLEEVRLTTWPGNPINGPPGTDIEAFQFDTGAANQFRRDKCPMCNGIPPAGGWSRTCPSCHGQPPNAWSCEAWQGVRFVMPETP